MSTFNSPLFCGICMKLKQKYTRKAGQQFYSEHKNVTSKIEKMAPSYHTMPILRFRSNEINHNIASPSTQLRKFQNLSKMVS